MNNGFIYIICILIAAAGSWVVQKVGCKIGTLDIPNGRSSHSKIIPKGGGVGILCAFLFAAQSFDISATLWVTALILSVMSFWGDKSNISPIIRLSVQFSCSLLFLSTLFFAKDTNILSFLMIIPLCVFISGTANFFNFMDGINGISGITGMVSFLLLWLFCVQNGVDQSSTSICLAVVFACMGFIPFNFPKARVFMGDTGSILLGYLFACMVVLLTNTIGDFICLAGFLFVFYVDELTTMIIRIKDKESIMVPHRRHLYQILANEYEISHWKISLSYGFSQLLIGLILLFLYNKNIVLSVAVLIFSFICFIILTLRVRFKMLNV